MSRITSVYREPFSLAPEVSYLPEGLSLAQLAGRMGCLPPDFADHGAICINGFQVPREHWANIRPKSAANGVPVEVTFHAAIRGGGDDGKNPLALIAAIALTAATGWIAGGGLVSSGILTGTVFEAGKWGALAIAGGVSLVGGQLLASLSPPPVVPDDTAVRNKGAASAQGNVLEPNGPIPRVTGSRKIFPPMAVQPFTYFEGEDEVVEAVYVLAGPHQLEDIRIAGAPLAEAEGVEYEIREGWPGDMPLELVERQSFTVTLQNEMRGHAVSGDDGTRLETETGDIGDALPMAITASTRQEPDEVLLHVAFPQGLHYKGEDDVFLRVPLRLRMREIGTETWINLPEIHYAAADIGQQRATIRLRWTDDATSYPGAASSKGWVEARSSSTGQSITPATDDREAHSYFTDGVGDDYMDANNLGTTGVEHVTLGRHVAEFVLDEATFPKGRYEIEAVRGYAIRETAYDPDGYTINGSVRDPFTYEDAASPKINQSKDSIADAVYILRCVSVWNEHPVPAGDLALIAIKARNRRVEQVSAMASGYVPDYGQPEPVLPEPTFERDQLTEIDESEFTRTDVVFAALDVTMPESPVGVIWEQGGGALGSYLGVSSGQLVLRAGNGAAPPQTDMARLSMDVSAFAGKRLTFYIEYDPVAASVSLWAYDHAALEVTVLGTASAASGFPSGEWAGTNLGGVGAYVGNMVNGEDDSDFNGTIHSARFWDATAAPDEITAPGAASWSVWRTSSNPAPHLRDMLLGRLNFDPVPEDIIDDDGLLAWRSACDAAGYQVNALHEGQSVDEAARIVAAAGYARPYMSDIWGVTRDYDRSGEGPVQIFTPRNSSSFRWSKGFAKLPDGFRITFPDKSRDYEAHQITAYRNPDQERGGLTEQVTYDALVTEAEVRARAEYDFLTAELRSAFYTLDAPAEAIVCRRGSLVGVQHDMLTRRAGTGRVADMAFNASGDVISITLDEDAPIFSEDGFDEITDMGEVADMGLIGARTGVVLRRTDGTITVHELSGVSAETATLTFASPVSATGLELDILVAVGALGTEYRRMIVAGMEPRSQFTWSITMVNEAPEIWA